jgi:hypothetical protein
VHLAGERFQTEQGLEQAGLSENQIAAARVTASG